MKQVNNQIDQELSFENISLIKKYDREMVSQSIAIATRQKHLRTLLTLSRLLKKNWKGVTKEDIDDLVFLIMDQFADESGQETHYSYDHKKILKIFFRWYKLGSREFIQVGDPPETKNVKMKKVKDKIAREDLLNEEDRIKILYACGENARDRALIDCHMEAGTRPGEILNLKIKHVKFDKHGCVLQVDGKTGARTIRIVRATPNLAAWIAVHPYKDEPEMPLWPNISHHKKGNPITYAAARQILHRRCKIANISKRVYLNLFRHSEATTTANFMTEAQMRKRHGWSSDSKMPARYVHLVNSDVEDAIFKHYGIKKEDEKMPEMPAKCHFCEMYNPSDSVTCTKCGKPLSLKSAIKKEAQENTEKKKLEEKIKMLEQRQIESEKNQKGYADLKSIIDEYLKEYFEDVFDKIEFVMNQKQNSITN